MSTAIPDFEELDHTADIAVRVHGETLASLFENAALGMVALIAGEVLGRDAVERHRIAIEAKRADELLREWLSEIIFLVSVKRAFPIRCSIERIDDRSVTAVLHMVPITEAIAREATEIKAVTWHGLRLERDSHGYTAEVVFDT